MTPKFGLIAILLLLPSAADADTCTVSASGVAFGSYSIFSTAPTNSTGTVTLTCKGNSRTSTPFSIALNAGLYGGGSFSNRRMISGTSYLAYQLYVNAGHSQVWGDGTGGTSTVSGTCTDNAATKARQCSVTSTVYGQIPALQTPVPGSYSDTVTVTVTY